MSRLIVLRRRVCNSCGSARNSPSSARTQRSPLGGYCGRQSCEHGLVAIGRGVRVNYVEEGSTDITLRLAKLTAVFCSLVAVLYAATASEPSPAVELFLSFGPLLAVIIWLQKDARRTGVGAVQDWGYFLFLAWPVVIPWYAFKTRGRAGWRLTAGLFGLILSAYIGGLAGAYFVWYFQLGAR